jgi:hypothetical protein
MLAKHIDLNFPEMGIIEPHSRNYLLYSKYVKGFNYCLQGQTHTNIYKKQRIKLLNCPINIKYIPNY